jgi:serine-type D-Ala-D-Ala carboxypeptidase/endopeptidase (penicillin-binding protein 4)
MFQSSMTTPSRSPRRSSRGGDGHSFLVALAVLGALVPAVARAQPPDVPGVTPIGHDARAAGSISKASLQAVLAREMGKAPKASGAWVYDGEAGEVIFGKRSAKGRIPASNMKVFTTAAAFTRFGATGKLETQIWQKGQVQGGVLKGNLFLVGGGDPSLATGGFGRRTHGVFTSLAPLATQVRAAGISKVTGRLYADDSIFDHKRGVVDSHGRTSPFIGPLSGLDFNSGHTSSGGGFSPDPARTAAASMLSSLRGAGVRVSKGVKLKRLPRGSSVVQLGAVSSPGMAKLIRETDLYSNNHWAEMLLKGLGARFRGKGTTRAGAAVVRGFLGTLGITAVHQVDGSGLSRPNRAAPAALGALLNGMLANPDADQFEQALPLAGVEGTLRKRMRGTAAAAHCRAKTGTLHDVSALSGYCFNGGSRVMVFSILMNSVRSVVAAQRIQDRMVAAIASY